MATVEDTAGARPAAEVLARARDIVGPAVRGAVETLPPAPRAIAEYHFGWRDEAGNPAGGAGGKLFRPALVLLAADAFGGAPETAVPAAVAVELVHNFSLLHDDVMDGDTTRRHRPTAWSVFGVGGAILAGDSLLALAFDVLAAGGHPAAADTVHGLSATVQRLIDGQSRDMAFERRSDVTPAECRAMAEAKTGALLGSACELGAVYGGAGARQCADLRRFGELLGLAFQIADDLLGIWGDPAVTGKPVHSDLRNRKKSLPVVAALGSGTPHAGELAALLAGKHPLEGADLVRAAELVELAGGRDWSERETAALLEAALAHLRAAAPPGRAAAELALLARLATRRDH
ncbi:family 2 encapsulin nanocompartment cargo protein polyprenyl transferase [Streptomonospora nanhaiensis]|uniref:Geranylgeranyl diphosphate synthase type I n=1 Tax=Streptomonospora nanhaiensis TaxID=1323731 RepID=A0A853BEK4_9ACTN|nr:family 2 encapsulin nanocompartment cargo protein polyprenyl transferase [Streptomonospora nanhaiensis]MBX9390377.1 polyprenyl synthetase family protein [Streptomonospora nanhaiensis]NYI93783.1 geranylgeranyl diphosphate synthase type I [Streptomonospora nanhaiensis]